MILRHTDTGFTIVEVLGAAGLSVMIFASLLAAYLAVKSVNQVAKHRIQALQMVRGEIEMLKATPFSDLNNAGVPPYNQPVNVFSNSLVYAGVFTAPADNFPGTLTVAFQDALDMDNDCATNPDCKTESSIDIDGDGVNDPTAVIPVRVSFTWQERVLSQSKNYTVLADTLIAK